MSEYLEPERVADALDIYLAELTAQARAFAGTIAKYVGDEMMVLWNAPHRQADHAMLAVRAGVEMLASMPAINERLAADGLPTIRYGIGVNTGEAVVGKMSAYSKQYDVLGDTVNVAARLCGAVDGGEMFIGEGTRQLIAGRAVLEVTDPLRLKGKGQPVRAYRVVSLLSDTRSVAGGLPRAVEPADA
jgi:adenylate cyclase